MINALSKLFERIPPIFVTTTGKFPAYRTKFSTGAELYSAKDVTIEKGKWKVVSTGFYLNESFKENYDVQVRPVASLAVMHGVTVMNSPDTIDPNYCGEVLVILINHSQTEDYHIKAGDAIAQLVVRSGVIKIREFKIIEEEKEKEEKKTGYTGVF